MGTWASYLTSLCLYFPLYPACSRTDWSLDPHCPGPPEFNYSWASHTDSFPSMHLVFSRRLSAFSWQQEACSIAEARSDLAGIRALGQLFKQWEWESWQLPQELLNQVLLKVTSRTEPILPTMTYPLLSSLPFMSPIDHALIHLFTSLNQFPTPKALS